MIESGDTLAVPIIELGATLAVPMIESGDTFAVPIIELGATLAVPMIEDVTEMLSSANVRPELVECQLPLLLAPPPASRILDRTLQV